MKRTPTWEIDLIRFIDSIRSKPFRWGSWDCCQMCGEAVKAMTGHNPVTDAFVKYDNKRAALKAIKAHGQRNLLDTLIDVLGPALSIHNAMRGDVVYTVRDDGPVIGMCLGQQSVFVEPEGLIEYPTLKLMKVFKIG